VLIAALWAAFKRLQGMMINEDIVHITTTFDRELGLLVSDARDMATHNDWLFKQCGTEIVAFARVKKRLCCLNGPNGFCRVWRSLQP